MIWEKNSLGKRLLFSIVLVTLIYGMTSALFVFLLNYKNEFTQLRAQQEQLVLALKPSAAAAVLEKNKTIATELINSLTRSPYILEIDLDSNSDFHVFYTRANSIDASDTIGISFPIYLRQTPQNKSGDFRVVFDQNKMAASALKAALFPAILTFGQALLLGLLIISVSQFILFRPLANLVKNVAALRAGERSRLDIPPYHHNNEIGLLGTSINHMLTSINDAMAQITRQKDIALQATASKSRFLATASHDLRQPMHALNMYLGILQHHSLSSEAQILLRKARQCGQSMDEMFHAFLDISKLDASIVKVNLEVFPLQKIIDQVLLEFQPVAHDKEITLSCVRTKAWVFSDANLVKNILRNLISNALRYTASGKILIGCRHKNEAISLSVIDTGCGISDAHKDQIFNDFYQVKSSEKSYDTGQGMGLGLAISQRLATLLDSKIEMVSQLERGTNFSILLKTTRPTVLAHANDALSIQENNLEARKNLLVLVIDDNEIILDSIFTMLTGSGFSTIVATSAELGIAQLIAENRAPDVILCDYQLAHNQSGLDAIERVRDEFASDIPSLIVTGDTAPEHLHELQARDIRVLHKPMQAEALLEEITDVIRQRRHYDTVSQFSNQ